MSPKLVDKDQRAKEIGEAALQLFIKKGYSSTSVGEIADAAGIGKGTIYEYFKTKEEIFVTVIMELSEQADSRFLEIMSRIHNPIEQLAEFINLNMEPFYPEANDISRIFIETLHQTFMEGGAFYNKHHLVKEMTVSRFQAVVSILLNGISKGIFKPEIACDVEKIAINLLAFLRGLGLHALVTEKMVDARAQIDFYMKTLLEMITIVTPKELK